MYKPFSSLMLQNRAGRVLAEFLSTERKAGGFACLPSFVDDIQQQKMLEDSIKDLLRAQAYTPDQSHIYYLMGRSFCLKGDYENAIEAFQHFSELRPKNPLGYLEMGFALLQACPPKGKCSNELNTYDMWRKAGVALGHFIDLAEEARQQENYDRAIFFYQSAQFMGMDLRSTIITMRYLSAEKKGDEQKAFELLRTAIRMDRGWLDQELRFDTWLQFGRACFQNGDYKCAERVLSTIIEEYRSNDLFTMRLVEAYEILGSSYLARQELDRALVAMRQALELDREHRTLSFVNFLLEYIYDYNLARDVLLEAINRYPNSNYLFSWYLRLGDVFMLLRNWDEAVNAYEASLSINPNAWQAYIGLGLAKYERGDNLDSSISQIKRAILFQDSKEIGYSTIGWIMYRAGMLNEADSWLAEALEKNPACYTCFAMRGNVAWARGDLELAISFFQSAIKSNPNYDVGYYELSLLFQLTNRYQDAIVAIQRAINLRYPPNPDYYVRAGNIFEASGRVDEAIKHYQTALQIDKENLTALEALKRLGVIQ